MTHAWNHDKDSDGNPMVNHLKWTFALILTPADVGDIPMCHRASRSMSFQEFVLHTCRKLARVGVGPSRAQPAPRSL